MEPGLLAAYPTRKLLRTPKGATTSPDKDRKCRLRIGQKAGTRGEIEEYHVGSHQNFADEGVSFGLSRQLLRSN